ncbi:Alpha/Beta hydrolase protein [Daldinia sp. FL1419]|nr:Alpha/Beta hydrolase protein [Daldinia sp. FL1419]
MSSNSSTAPIKDLLKGFRRTKITMDTYGLFQVYDSGEAKVDIVFLHGLRGDIEKTWTKEGVLWPKDLLPQDIPESRIFLFGYDTSITQRDPSRVANTEIHSDANDLCTKLAAERSSTDTNERPIILVAHSLGGLVAAQVLVHGDQRAEASSAEIIAKNIRGLIFLGTPFRGSPSARKAEVIRRILQVFGANTQEHTLKLLGVDSERLDELTRAFPEVLNKRRASKNPSDRIEAFFFYEVLKTKIGFGSTQIVEPESAQIPGCGDAAPIRADHIGICKFKTQKDEGYNAVVAAIRKIMMPTSSNSQQGTKIINILGRAVNVAADDINIQNQTVNL